MAEARDYLGEKLWLVERAREDVYFRQLDQALIATMRAEAAKETAEAREASRLDGVFTPLLVPVDFSPYATQALLCAALDGESGHAGNSQLAHGIVPNVFAAQTLACETMFPLT